MMEFIDLKTQYMHLEKTIRNGIDGVLSHGKYIMGPEIAMLEQSLSEKLGVKNCISCANGTDALQMVLMAWNIGPGDAVFVPSFTFMSTAEVVRLVGATPYFVDSEPDSFNMCPRHLAAVIANVKKRGVHCPKVIIPVDIFGLIANYEAIGTIAEEHQLLILEDAAQSMGASLAGKFAGSFGHAATTSFFPAKPLGCYGDGGAIFTNDEELAAILKSIRVHGQGSDKYDNVRVGLNARLDTFQAAILLAKLTVFDQEIAARQRVADHYKSNLGQRITVPSIPADAVSAWAQYTIITCSQNHRQRIQNALKVSGIPTMVYYQKPLHLQEAYGDIQALQHPCPVAENLSDRVLSLPMHPYMELWQIEKIAAIINSVEAE